MDSYNSLHLKKVAPVSLSCSLFFFFPQLFHFFISHLSFSALSSRWSPFSSIVYLSCYWIFLSFYHDCWLRLCETLPSFSTFTFLFETFFEVFTQFDSTCFLQLIVSFCLLFRTFSFFLLHRLSSSIPPAN